MFGTGNYNDTKRQIAKTGLIGRGKVKQVFDYPQCAHIWAAQSQEAGRSTKGQMYFRDETIYSYGEHFAMARFTGVEFNGMPVVLFNNGKASNTTTTHQDHVRNALRGLPVKVFYVPNVKARWESDSATATLHAGNVAAYVEAFDAMCARAAKPHVRASYNEDARHAEHERTESVEPAAIVIYDYCRAFNLESPALDIESKVAAIRAAFTRYNSPKKVAARLATASNKTLKHAATMSAVHAFLEGVTATAPSIAFLPREIAGESKWQIESKIRAIHEARRPKSHRNHITRSQWVEGVPGTLDWSEHSKPTLVRRVGDTLETSRGASCPFKHSIVAFLKAQECRATGNTWKRNGQQIRVGAFSVDSIDVQGNMIAGCHTLKFEEMARLAFQEVPHLVKACFPLPAVI